MPINQTPPPAGARDAIFRGVTTLLRPADDILASTTFAGGVRHSVALPHRIAYLRLDRLQGTDDLRHAVVIRNWRYLVYREGPAAGGVTTEATTAGASVLLAAATASRLEGDAFKFGALNRGPLVEGTEKAIRVAEEEYGLGVQGDFEAYLLLVPSLYVAAVWLKDHESEADGKSDIVLVLPPARPGFTAYRRLDAGGFIRTLRELNESDDEEWDPNDGDVDEFR